VTSPLRPFSELRESLREAPTGDGGGDVCEALTARLDEAIEELAAGLGTDVAVVAIGGYGRREQCIWSDVDIMLLHRRDDPEPLVRSVLYPLWDAHLAVGHAVRTVADCRAAALDDFETLTSLLSARLIVGDADLFGELIGVLVELVRHRPLTTDLVGRERARRARDPYPVMAADLKEGRGALRTHQGFWWERRRAELLGLDVTEATPDEVEARNDLLRVRNALHAVSGRAMDRYVVDLREPAAAWLGTNPYDLSARLMAALDLGDRLADRWWPDLHTEADPLVGFGRRLFGRVRSRFGTAENDAVPADSVLELALRAAGRRSGVFFHPQEEAMIRAAAPAAWTEADRSAFVKLLAAGERGRTVFGFLDHLGWVDRELPEWGPVATAPQLAPFHDHPVGAHLWRTAAEMRRLVEDRGPLGEIATELGDTEVLFLAAFFHDIGKARDGDHSVIGAELAGAFLRRHGFGAATSAAVVDAVRHHLLLSETATRRDIDDPAVIDEVASLVGNLPQLQVLYLLTVADLRATGTTMWNSWRASLLERLYQRVREALEAGGAVPATPDVEALLAWCGPDCDRRSVEEHVAAMPSDYLATTDPGDVLWHLRVADDLDGPAAVVPHPDDPGRVLVAGRDRAGFLVAVTRAFTSHGVGILDARLRTRADGVALDTFHVLDDRTGSPVPSERWARIAADLVAGLEGRRDLAGASRRRTETYRPRRPRSGAEVKVHREGRYTVIEVRAPDRVGLLAEIVEVLYLEGLDIHLARIDTMGGQARDVFFTRRVGGIPILTGAESAALRRRLEDRLGAL